MYNLKVQLYGSPQFAVECRIGQPLFFPSVVVRKRVFLPPPVNDRRCHIQPLGNLPVVEPLLTVQLPRSGFIKKDSIFPLRGPIPRRRRNGAGHILPASGIIRAFRFHTYRTCSTGRTDFRTCMTGNQQKIASPLDTPEQATGTIFWFVYGHKGTSPIQTMVLGSGTTGPVYLYLHCGHKNKQSRRANTAPRHISKVTTGTRRIQRWIPFTHFLPRTKWGGNPCVRRQFRTALSEIPSKCEIL